MPLASRVMSVEVAGVIRVFTAGITSNSFEYTAQGFLRSEPYLAYFVATAIASCVSKTVTGSNSGDQLFLSPFFVISTS